jgi:hypothetical protein
MIRLVVVLFFLASLWLVAPADAADEISEIDVCRDFSLIAKDIMTARQKDRPMSETLPTARDRIKDWADNVGFDMDTKKAEGIAADLVMAAYDIPVYPIDRLAQVEISQFENQHFEECYTGLTSD